jgi:class 3 adenylate cyclase
MSGRACRRPRLKRVQPVVKYTKTGDFNIAYQVVGNGPIDLLLLPGWITHLELQWDVPPLARLLGRLAGFSRLILFDKRGTGLSDRVSPFELPTLEERMDEVRAVMDAAGSEKAVLFGTIGGGAMSGLFAATFPERALGLILYGTFGRLEPDTGLLARLAPTQEAAVERIEREWGTEGVCVSFWAPSVVTDEETKSAYLRLARSSVSPGSARVLMQMGYAVDWEAFLPAVHVPTLVLHRADDLVVPVHQGRKLAELIPGAKFIELPGSDHLMWAGDQQAVLREVEAFLGTLGPRPRDRRLLMTILFTDIVESTETAARLGDDGWRALLDEHHRVVREQLERYRGHEVETAGDSFLATFDGPARAIECAQGIVESAASIGLTLRAGLHTGEAEVTNDGLRGIAVNVAARTMALAKPGEVLVSSTSKDLVAGSGIAFRDRGTFEMKGLPGEHQLFAVETAATYAGASGLTVDL